MRLKKKNKEEISETLEAVGHINLVHSGGDFFTRMTNLITLAKHEIHLQTYIFDNDSSGNLIADALKVAASKGVQVYVLLDGYGTSLSKTFVKDLISAGVHLRFFAPMFSESSIYLGRRLHHKILVTDGKEAIIGGINIADKYHGDLHVEPWLDYAVQFEGLAAEPLQNLCRNI